jgi:hypothetical protein
MNMGHEWLNPVFERRRRTGRLAGLAVLSLALVAFAFWLLRRGTEGSSPRTVVEAGAGSVPASVRRVPFHEEPASSAGQPAAAAPEPGPPVLGETGEGASPAGMPPDDFEARKALALSLYRRDELAEAREQVQAALELRPDAELFELRARLEKELRVQRNYDDARTANFAVFFDGYEHEEMRTVVLDILKDAYAEVGKELDHFPARPISVILYTAKDFSEITDAPVWAGGLFGQGDGKIRLPVQGAAGRERQLRRVLFHEYTHALLYDLAPACPLWLQEGLAQYFSGDKAVSVGQAIPLGMLAGGFPREPRAALVAYMESLQAVADLVEERGMARMRQLLNGLGSGRGLEAAFAAAYGRPFSRWAESWRPLARTEAAEDDER